jgi:hypothetical protein
MSAVRKAVCERIGGGYRLGRREDPRIADAIRAAPGDTAKAGG